MPKKFRHPHPGPVGFESVPFEHAVKYFDELGVVPTWSYKDLWASEESRAFTVAKLTQLDLLEAVHDHIGKAIKDGTSLEEFTNNVGNLLESSGWGGTEHMIPSRLENIYRTNLASAYAAGEDAQMKESAEARADRGERTFLEGNSVGDDRTREEHAAAMDGVVLPIEDPYWDTHTPPLDYMCRCWVTEHTEESLDRYGLDETSEDARPDESTEVHELPDGQSVTAPVGVGPGFGRRNWDESVARSLVDRLAGTDQAFASAIEKQIEKSAGGESVAGMAKRLIQEGKDRETVIREVKEAFPDNPKINNGVYSYYRAKLEKAGKLGGTPPVVTPVVPPVVAPPVASIPTGTVKLTDVKDSTYGRGPIKDAALRARIDKAVEFVDSVNGTGRPIRALIYDNNVSSMTPKFTQKGARDIARIGIARDAPVQHVVHEMGHLLENEDPRILKSARALLERVKRDNPTAFRQAQDTIGNAARERTPAYKLQLAYKYTVRSYEEELTEVLSTGIEKLYEDAVNFERDMPLHYKWTKAILRGEIPDVERL